MDNIMIGKLFFYFFISCPDQPWRNQQKNAGEKSLTREKYLAN